MEQQQSATLRLVQYKCDKCKVGEMHGTGIALMTSPPQFPHACNKCGFAQTLRKTYPGYEISA